MWKDNRSDSNPAEQAAVRRIAFPWKGFPSLLAGLPLAYPVAAATGTAWSAVFTGVSILLVTLLSFTSVFLLKKWTEGRSLPIPLTPLLLFLGTLFASLATGVVHLAVSPRGAIALAPAFISSILVLVFLQAKIPLSGSKHPDSVPTLIRIASFGLVFAVFLILVGILREGVFSGSVFAMDPNLPASLAKDAYFAATGWMLAGVVLALSRLLPFNRTAHAPAGSAESIENGEVEK